MSASAIKIQITEDDEDLESVNSQSQKKEITEISEDVSGDFSKAKADKKKTDKSAKATKKALPKTKIKEKTVAKKPIKVTARKMVTQKEIVVNEILEEGLAGNINEEKKEIKLTNSDKIKNKFPDIKATPVGVESIGEIKTDAVENDKVKSMIAQLEKEGENKEEAVSVPELENSNIHAGRSVSIYRRIAYFFIFLVIVLLGFIAYYTFVKVKIVIIPNQERISNNMIFDIRDQDLSASESGNTVSGVVKKIEIESTKQFNSSGTEVIGKEVSGIATVYNNYTKNQPLVASTRLLSADNKLFRIRNTVNVPAGGSVEVEIYADEPGPDSAIGKTTLSIPGLWAGLQDKIFAETKESIDYKQKVKKYILQTDIDDGIRELKQQLLTDAKSQINEEYKDYGEIIYKINENTVTSKVDKKVGEEVEDFNIAMTAEVVVVAFNEDKTADLAKQKFLSSLSENKELISFDEKNIVYTLSNYDSNQGSATISATFEGKISVKDNFDIIEVDKIVGLNHSQLEVYLKNISEIAGYEIKYTPSFIKRVPNLVDRITIEIKK
ncbi:TPA: hypothetical protein DDY55_05840 [Candidatus Falkowbacteria bacterium]|nr:hypothetical protein [Candidatus Falkowbacteria bacterium]HAY12831.1 hypothetical protein [Candidatus Falkowbacteria bacterium]HBI97595.1 hypothetical protein [Candidatus Falkowbacteria bacterium]HBT27055.1 hypothetical protein [Candidatus Falkowbacteria bacterium]HBY15349.1 hypothetical protein [Candidatus Falkowbacteria bacterium]